MSEIEKYLSENCFELTRENIYELNKIDNGPINNVLSHLNQFCYGVQIFDDKEFIEYELFYIDYKYDLRGFSLVLSLAIKEDKRLLYTTEFCKILNREFPHVDRIDAVNAFQLQARSVFEKYGYFTFGNEISIFEGKNAVGILPLGCKGHLSFPTFEKLKIYRWFFGEDENIVKVDESKTKKVYLILDSKNNLIKIGQSFNPKVRERTLQGESPKWDIITTWIAPAFVEKELHEKYKHKRIRGEWFKLIFNDLEEIREYMKEYKNSL